jgi:hypothetical protein
MPCRLEIYTAAPGIIQGEIEFRRQNIEFHIAWGGTFCYLK